MKIIPMGDYSYTTDINTVVNENGVLKTLISDKAIEIPYATEDEFNKVFGVSKKFVNGILSDIPFDERKARNAYRIRQKRESVCFPVINRGKLWYDTLSEAQIQELNQWYSAWLEATDTLIEPSMPTWLN